MEDADEQGRQSHGREELLGFRLHCKTAQDGQRVGHDGVVGILQRFHQQEPPKRLLHVAPNDLIDLKAHKRRWNSSGASLPIIHFRCQGSAVRFAKQNKQLILTT